MSVIAKVASRATQVLEGAPKPTEPKLLRLRREHKTLLDEVIRNNKSAAVLTGSELDLFGAKSISDSLALLEKSRELAKERKTSNLGITFNSYSAHEFNRQVRGTRASSAANQARGGGGAAYNAMPSESELKVQDVIDLVEEKGAYAGKPSEDELHLAVHEGEKRITPRLIKEMLQGAEHTLKKPLYVVRSENAFSSGQGTDALHSADIIDPLDIEAYLEHYTGGPEAPRVYKLEPGASVYSTEGWGDTPQEVLVSRPTLKAAQSADTPRYFKALKTGKALFATAGVAAGVTAGSEDVEAATDQSKTIQNLIAQGTKPSLIQEALSSRFSSEETGQMMQRAYQPKIDELVAQGVSPELITQSFAQQGVTINLGSETAPEVAQPATPAPAVEPPAPEEPNTDKSARGKRMQDYLAKAVKDIAGFGTPVGFSAEKPDIQLEDGRMLSEVIARVKNVDFTYAQIGNELLGATGLSAESKFKAAETAKDNNLVLQSELKKFGLDVQSVNENGEVMVVNPETGELTAFDETLFDALDASAYEMGLAVTGGIAGARLGAASGNPFLTAVGGVLGAAGSAMLGRGTDVIRNSLLTQRKLNAVNIIDKMNDAGIAEVTLGALGLTVPGVIQGASYVTRKSLEGANNAYRFFQAGNEKGAVDTLLANHDMNQAQAIELTGKWEVLTGNKVLSEGASKTGKLGIDDAVDVVRVVTETVPGGEAVVRGAINEADAGGAKLSAQIDARARDLLKEADNITSDRVTTTVRDDLNDHIEAVKTDFDSIKTLGTDAMQDSEFRFDFDATLVPAMKLKTRGITNPMLKTEFVNTLELIRDLTGIPYKSPTANTAIKGARARVTATRSATTAARAERAAINVELQAAKKRARLLKTPKAVAKAADRVSELTKKLTSADKKILTSAQDVAKSTSEVVNVNQATADAIKPAVADQPRTFKDLLELRKVLNELSNNSQLKGHTNFAQLKAAMTGVDSEIKRASKVMENGDVWHKLWGEANANFSNMKVLENNVLFKALTSKQASPDSVVKAFTQSLSYEGPESFMEVLGKLPVNTRGNVEGAVVRHLMDKWTGGQEGAKIALNLPSLAKDLNKLAFTQTGARDLKRMVNEFADVFKNDWHLQIAARNMPAPAFHQSLALDPVSKVKYAFMSSAFNTMRSRVPFGSNAGRAALVKQFGKILDNPLEAQASKAILDALPDDPELKTSLHQLAIQFVEGGKIENYGKVPIYRVSKPGKANTASETSLGNGMLHFTDKKSAQKVAKATGSNVKEVMQVHKNIATPEDVARIIGHEPTLADFRDPEVVERLRREGAKGIAFKDKVLVFK